MTESPGVLFERLLDVMMRLRAPHGCPWDREQTRTSLKPYLIEEAYEVLEAIESDQSAPLKEELGDVLFQVVFHARLAQGQAESTMGDLLEQLSGQVARLAKLDAEDVLNGAIEKFRRRFSGMEAELVARGTSVSAVTPGELEQAWEAAKAGERREKQP